MKSDESAFSIVPSELSSRLSLSTNESGDHDSLRSYESIVYHRLSFEDELFTARVYKRITEIHVGYACGKKSPTLTMQLSLLERKTVRVRSLKML